VYCRRRYRLFSLFFSVPTMDSDCLRLKRRSTGPAASRSEIAINRTIAGGRNSARLEKQKFVRSWTESGTGPRCQFGEIGWSVRSRRTGFTRRFTRDETRGRRSAEGFSRLCTCARRNRGMGKARGGILHCAEYYTKRIAAKSLLRNLIRTNGGLILAIITRSTRAGRRARNSRENEAWD